MFSTRHRTPLIPLALALLISGACGSDSSLLVEGDATLAEASPAPQAQQDPHGDGSPPPDASPTPTEADDGPIESTPGGQEQTPPPATLPPGDTPTSPTPTPSDPPPPGGDLDGDGYTAAQGDCDDADPAVHPGAAERCNWRDDDCDGARDEDFPGLGAPCDGEDADRCQDGAMECSPDGLSLVCVDNTVDSAEVCNGRDDDCDGVPDEGLARVWYADDDGDGFGDGDRVLIGCSQPPSSAPVAGDCDDGDGAVNPDAAERMCNGADDDCDPATPDDVDGDRDGVSVCEGDCDDDPTRAPGNVEICDGKDNDCDGLVDQADDDVRLDTWCRDLDHDGFPSSSCTYACVSPGADWVQIEGRSEVDCDDARATIHPGAQEICDGIDDDCDRAVDEGAHADLDGDGYYTCSADPDLEDCDDTSPAVHPGEGDNPTHPFTLSAYLDIDNDCDGSVDEDAEEPPAPSCDAAPRACFDGHMDFSTGRLILDASCSTPPCGETIRKYTWEGETGFTLFGETASVPMGCCLPSGELEVTLRVDDTGGGWDTLTGDIDVAICGRPPFWPVCVSL